MYHFDSSKGASPLLDIVNAAPLLLSYVGFPPEGCQSDDGPLVKSTEEDLPSAGSGGHARE